jgi:hypothetical protein
MSQNKKVPNAFVVLEKHRGSTPNWVVLDCPYCGGVHRHLAGGGITDPYDALGGRASHCSPGGEYVLVAKEPRKPWKPKKRAPQPK